MPGTLHNNLASVRPPRRRNPGLTSTPGTAEQGNCVRLRNGGVCADDRAGWVEAGLGLLEFDRLITAWHRSNEMSMRLDEAPGVGPVLATAESADPTATIGQHLVLQ
jgi:hypothetical protein